MNGVGQRATRQRDLMTWLVAGAISVTALAVTGTYWFATRHKEKPVPSRRMSLLTFINNSPDIPSPIRTAPAVSTRFMRQGQCPFDRDERRSSRTC